MKKGRSVSLIKKRDAALVRRYHHWTEVQRLRFDDALRVLSEQEFFLSEQRIIAIIRAASRRPEMKPCKPVPKVKKPRITQAQIDMLRGEDA
nr:transposase [Paramuribaculum intestinale]